MTYEDFEIAAFDEDVPYILIKVIWEKVRRDELDLSDEELKILFREAIKGIRKSPGALEFLREASKMEFDPGTIEEWAEMIWGRSAR